MKLKLQQIMEMDEPLSQLLNEKMPLKLAFRFTALLNQVRQPAAAFNETKEKLIKEFGEEKEGSISVKPEYLKEFYKQVSEALAIEVDIDFEQVDLNELPEGIQITPANLSRMYFLFKQ